ncbi:glycosyltransferase [Achromobacter xylosoxidans]|uniref:glycosyltransferase n=1 Tax=Alcaligenes xylosoxydans xylosoxydans TaxID=85698 RepID=UPI00047C622C|nr:glycosyltransferase [Achromobacter xylosoxidans]MCH4595904.1 glycosyltransferase [Achromobacter xylosoxidans]MDH0519366.1 glycosyltransferase [Achromobacter xylosoxidans]MDH0546551.1 glycosyltransferase [Achromobacter xylosoxidans]MDZ5616237.1 glycosyltransferase [Achromobacter xylosoxidans]CUJ00736.1 Bactoprenol glucosyl transferase homolog from prophage CPS-53 [Achromobacter xylosoxidans]
MPFFPVFLSVAVVVRNQSAQLEQLLTEVASGISSLVSNYELIVVDNASDDDSVAVLKRLTREDGHPNLQIYALTKVVDVDTASWVGLENALGDFVAVIDPLADDIGFLPEMLDKAVSGADVVFAANALKAGQGAAYRIANAIFNSLYKRFNGVHLAKEAPQYRILSKRVINFILQHPQPAMSYRHLPATGGFARSNLNYSAKPRAAHPKKLWDSINRGMRLLVSTTGAPMRMVTALSLFGAGANLVYSVYVVAVGFLKADVAPGWVSLSLQQSGMFFLLSLVLLVLGEYILNMVSLSNEGPIYHVGQEFTSARMTRHEKLNVEEVMSKPADPPGLSPRHAD